MKLETRSTGKQDTDPSKHKKSRKGKEREAPPHQPRPRSLSPIAQVDTFAVAHAIQDLRRYVDWTALLVCADLLSHWSRNALTAAPPLRYPNPDDSFEFPDPISINAAHDGYRDRSQSTPMHRDSVEPRASSHTGEYRVSMTQLPEHEDLTEEDKDAKFGPWVTISVGMVHDPRIAVTDQNTRSVTQFCATIDIKMRSVR